MTPPLSDLTERLLAAARKAGADAADAMAVQGTALSIDVRKGGLEQAERSEGVEIGLRVFLGQRQAMVSASDIRDATMADMAERAVAMAREAPEDPNIGLADPGAFTTRTDAGHLELFDPDDAPSPQDLLAAATEAEAAALAVASVTQVQSAAASGSQSAVHIATSAGFSGGYRRSDRSLYAVAIAGTGTGMERDHDGDSRIFATDLRSAQDIGTSAGRRAVERLSPMRPKTGHYPVLFDERISSSLIGHLLAAISGTAVARGASWLRDGLGTQVLPTGLSVIEDPHRPRVSGSRPFDAAGLATRQRAIVQDGILTGWTLDLSTGRKLGMASTANATRGPGSAPSPSNWNIALTEGTQSREDLLREMGTGLWITSMIGATINPNTGDYSRGAAGFWVENGEPVAAASEITVAGNLRDMLRTIVPANDARAHLSRVVPSLLVEGLTLAGS